MRRALSVHAPPRSASHPHTLEHSWGIGKHSVLLSGLPSWVPQHRHVWRQYCCGPQVVAPQGTELFIDRPVPPQPANTKRTAKRQSMGATRSKPHARRG